MHVIVSGGQGKDEEVTEAYAMARYLECEGLDRRRIVQEDVSVNTLENLKFSRNLIADVDTPVGIVSNNFHVYRGCVYAKRAGFKEPFPIPASCHPLLFPNYFVRECFAVWIVDKDCNLNILTFESEGGAWAFRHTTSHIMAQAIKRLYPGVKLAIGPSVADGFYYDVDSETPLTAEDLVKIEAEMKKIVKRSSADHTFHKVQRRSNRIFQRKRRAI